MSPQSGLRNRPGGTILSAPMFDAVAQESMLSIRRLRRHSVLSERVPAGSVVAAMVIGFSVWKVLHGRAEMFNRGGVSEVARFFADALHPRTDAEFLRITVRATAVTLSYAVLATVLSAASGLVIGAFLSTGWRATARPKAASRRPADLLRTVAKTVLIPVRGIHEVIWALVLLNILGLDPLVAIGALVLPFSALTAKVFTNQLDAVDPSAPRSMRAAGASEVQVFFYGVLPTALPDLTSYTFYRLECAIRSAAVLGIVGAGGIGYELQLSFQSLAYREMWTMLFALILVSGVADAMSTRVRQRRRSAMSFASAARPAPTVRRLGAIGILGVAVGWSVATLNLHPTHLWSQRSTRLFGELLRSWFPPDFHGPQVRRLAALSVETATVSVVSIALSFALALLVAFLAARQPGARFSRRVASQIARFVLLVTRAIPPSVWAFLTVLVFFPGLLSAAVALGVYNFGVLGRLLAEVVEHLDVRPTHSLRVLGAKPSQVFCYGVVPTAVSRFASYGLYRWEVATRETIVVGIVAAGGLGDQLRQRLAALDYPQVTAALLFFIGLTLAIDLVSTWLRRRVG